MRFASPPEPRQLWLLVGVPNPRLRSVLSDRSSGEPRRRPVDSWDILEDIGNADWRDSLGVGYTECGRWGPETISM